MAEKKRVSMRGMGADAFFAPPVEKLEEAEQKETAPAQQQRTSVEVPPVQTTNDQERNREIQVQPERSPFVPDVEVKQQRSTPAKRDTSVILDQETGQVKYIKVSYYIEPGQDMKLEEIRLSRRKRGMRVDKSELIREAIEKLTE